MEAVGEPVANEMYEKNKVKRKVVAYVKLCNGDMAERMNDDQRNGWYVENQGKSFIASALRTW